MRLLPRLLVLSGCLLGTSISEAQVSISPSPGDDLFLEEVLPLLKERCFKCHGPHAKRLRGGLMMSSHDSLIEGGDSGAAIVPGDPDASLLIELVLEADEEFRMPPKGQLDRSELALLEKWIGLGAPWPGGEELLRDVRDIDLDAGRQWWSFRPPAEPEAPTLLSPASRALVKNEIDSFIFARLEAENISPAARANDAQLVRRLHFDLLGLPPSPERARDYAASSDPDKWAQLVDELLAKVEYAERQARSWLDVVRFAQTSGYERDAEKPMAWRYRDYVIRSFHDDKPYDQFLRQQLAGDEFENPTQADIIATGFYRLGTWDSEPDDRAQADLDIHDDVLRTISEGMLALTIGCARCHDHRTDPIRQEDYYSLLAFVQNVAPYRKPKFSFDSLVLRALDATPKHRKQREDMRENSQAHAQGVVDRFAVELLERHPEAGQAPKEPAARISFVSKKSFQKRLSNDDRLQLYILKTEAAGLEDSFQGNLTWALAAIEPGPETAATHVLRRGRSDSPVKEVLPVFPPVLCASDGEALPSNIRPRESSSGRRTALAEWITDPRHPLTARVMVNRLWQGHFGSGLCETPNDFGVTGARPSHPQLLDWLALRFLDSGWSVKAMHRLILNSHTYTMLSSRVTPPGAALDPANRLLWRQNLRRLDAESLRDSCLAVAGSLNKARGGRGFFPALSREALAGGSKPGLGWEKSSLEQRNRRAVYTYAKRGQLDPLLEVFDLCNPSLPSGSRAETTVASQALSLLNSRLLGRSATSLAERVRAEFPGQLEAQLGRLYGLTVARTPHVDELQLARDFIASQTQAFAAGEAALVFRASVPDRLELEYLRLLAPEDLFFGPDQGWSFVPGQWGLRYNQTEQFDRLSGPAALLDESRFSTGEVSLRLSFLKGTPFVGLLLRARSEQSGFAGLQLFLDREAGEISLLEHRTPAGTPTYLARAPLAIDESRDLDLIVRLEDSTLRAWVDEHLVIEYEGLAPDTTGGLGLRTWGAGCEVRGLVVNYRIIPVHEAMSAEQKALASFALVLLNLNEFIYID
jgi:hypothetical protein